MSWILFSEFQLLNSLKSRQRIFWDTNFCATNLKPICRGTGHKLINQEMAPKSFKVRVKNENGKIIMATLTSELTFVGWQPPPVLDCPVGLSWPRFCPASVAPLLSHNGLIILPAVQDLSAVVYHTPARKEHKLNNLNRSRKVKGLVNLISKDKMESNNFHYLWSKKMVNAKNYAANAQKIDLFSSEQSLK